MTAPSNNSGVSPAHNLVLVFDWGNTLMQVLPQFTGPMAAWPEVAEVDGVIDALEKLKGRHTLVVATNAGDSRAEDVWKALRRVGFGEYFTAVFTSRELDSRKPHPAFFRQLEKVLDRPARELVMIGDDYIADVLGAKKSGWSGIWYNPSRQPAPGLLPVHDAELSDMRNLPALIERPFLPDYATTLAWLLETGTPYNILQHVHLVAVTAYLLAVWLGQHGMSLDPLLVQRGGLLHDLMKMESIRQKESGAQPLPDHARMACDWLLAHDQPALAELADRHMPTNAAHPERWPETWEQKLVHYADKLAEGSQLVPLDTRLLALKGRYPAFAGALDESQPFLVDLQSQICARLAFSPDQLMDRLRAAITHSNQ